MISKSKYSSKDFIQDVAVAALITTMCMLAFLRRDYLYGSQDYDGIVSVFFYVGIGLKIIFVIGSLYLLLRLQYPQSLVAGIVLVGCWLLAECFPNSVSVLFLKELNDVFGYFGGVFIYPIWRWQRLTNTNAEVLDDKPTTLNLNN